MRRANRVTLLMITVVWLPILTVVVANLLGRWAVRSTKTLNIHVVATWLLIGMVHSLVFAFHWYKTLDTGNDWHRFSLHKRIRRVCTIGCGMLLGLIATFYMHFSLACTRYDGRYSRGESTSGVAYALGPTTFLLPAVLIGSAAGLLMSWFVCRSVDDDEIRETQCPECGYPLYGLPSNRCPECGHTVI